MIIANINPDISAYAIDPESGERYYHPVLAWTPDGQALVAHREGHLIAVAAVPGFRQLTNVRKAA